MRTRAYADRDKLAQEGEGELAARASGQHLPAAAAANATRDGVEKCINCQYYDRRRARPTDGKVPMWGQCRRHSPHLNPVTAKAYVVEGVWPLVRDDDWCGEWKVIMRIADDPVLGAPALPAQDAPASTPTRSRPMPVGAAIGDD